jgi:hypothetical protein
VRLGKAQTDYVSHLQNTRQGTGTERGIQDARPADHSIHGETGHGSLPISQLLALHDPTFPDMYEWLTLSAKDNGQHYPQTLSAPIAETSDMLPDTTAVEKMDFNVLKTATTTPKRSPSPGLSQQDSSKDDGQHYPIAEISDILLDIAAVEKMDVDVLGTATTKSKRPPSPSLSRQDSSKRLKATTASEDSILITLPPTPPKQTPTFKPPNQAAADRNDKLGPVGISRSAIASQKLKAEMRAGTHTINKARQKTFESECCLSDPYAEFRYGENWQVFHSQCGKWLVMTEAYNSTRFRQHIKGCKKMGSGSKFTTLNSFIVKGPAKQMEAKITVKATAPSVPTAEYPCLGITASHDQHVTRFITRTGAEGGGARSVTKIANELFNKTYGELSERKKSQVDAVQMHEWSFRFDRLRMAIHSSKCKRFVSAPQGEDHPHTCHECLGMYDSDQRLKSGLQKPMPQPENFKYLNEQYQGKSTAERYAKTQGLLEIIQDKVCFQCY